MEDDRRAELMKNLEGFTWCKGNTDECWVLHKDHWHYLGHVLDSPPHDEEIPCGDKCLTINDANLERISRLER